MIRFPDQKRVIKAALDKKGVPSQFMLVGTVKKPITVYSNLLKQMNAKLKSDLYRLNVSKEFKDSMVVGVDVCHAGKDSIVGLAATYTPHLT